MEIMQTDFFSLSFFCFEGRKKVAADWEMGRKALLTWLSGVHRERPSIGSQLNSIEYFMGYCDSYCAKGRGKEKDGQNLAGARSGLPEARLSFLSTSYGTLGSFHSFPKVMDPKFASLLYSLPTTSKILINSHTLLIHIIKLNFSSIIRFILSGPLITGINTAIVE